MEDIRVEMSQDNHKDLIPVKLQPVSEFANKTLKQLSVARTVGKNLFAILFCILHIQCEHINLRFGFGFRQFIYSNSRSCNLTTVVYSVYLA